MKPIFFQLLVILFLLIACTDREIDKVSYYPINGNAWQIELLKNKTDDSNLVYSTYDGRICAFNLDDEKTLWEYDTEAFIFDLKTGDIDLDGLDEIVAVSASGVLFVLDITGKLKWQFEDINSLFTVGIGEFDPDHQGLEIVTGGFSRNIFIFNKNGNNIHTIPGIERLVFRLTLFDLDEDDSEEILAIENRTIAHAIDLDNAEIKTLWRKPLTVPDEYINWENPRGRFHPFSLTTEDLDDDGKNEIISGDVFFNKQSVLVTDLNGNPYWISENVPWFNNRGDRQTEFYSTAFVGVADFFAEIPGKEILAISGGNFRLFDKSGNKLGESDCLIGFTDFAIKDKNVYLSSSPNGDNTLYRIAIDEDWENTVSNIKRTGKINRIGDNLKKLKNQVIEYNGSNSCDTRYWIMLSFERLKTTDEGLDNYQKAKDWFYRKFPYSNLSLLSSVKAIEPTPPLDENGNPWFEYRWSVDAINGTMTVDEIIEKAKWIEKNKIPTIFYIGHSCMPFITLETAEKILMAAPNYCVGFQTMEDEMLDLIPRYFKHFFGPLADLCVQHGYKLVMTKNKGLWWLSSPANKDAFEAMFKGERKKVILAATEDSNSRTPELNLLSRGGLWQAGLLNHNEVSIHSDLFSFNRYFQWEYPKTGSPFIRLMVAHTTLGMSQFNARIKEIYEDNGDFVINLVGRESTEIYYHMLGKNIIFSTAPENILGYNPVGIIVHQPSREWLVDAHNGHSPEKWIDSPELNNAVIPHNGCPWGMTNTPDHALQSVLLNKSRQFGYQIPSTPYGLIAFVPDYADLKNIAGISDWWHTDGIYIWKNDTSRKYTGKPAAEILQSVFEMSAKEMAFRIQGNAFLNALRIKQDHYRLFLIDPGYLDPSVRKVQVRIQLDGRFKAMDILSKDHLTISKDQMMNVDIPAGSLRIIDVVKD